MELLGELPVNYFTKKKKQSRDRFDKHNPRVI